MARIPAKLKSFLEKNKIKREIIEHRTVYTAFDKAATLKVKPNIVGKTLVLKSGKELFLALIPGNKNLDLVKIRKLFNDITRLRPSLRLRTTARRGKFEFVTERIMKNKFQGFKIGALPPFGQLFKLPTFIDRGILKEKIILANAGIHEASLKVSPKIFDKLENVILGNFSRAK